MFSSLLAQREADGNPIRVGIIGTGKFGAGLVAQIAQMKGMEVSAIADINLTNQCEAREGYALYQRWVMAYPDVRYLLISGDQRNTTLPAIHVGAVPFLAKPFGIRELITTVQGLLSRSNEKSIESDPFDFWGLTGGNCFSMLEG